MEIVVRCSDAQKEELVSKGVTKSTQVAWVFEKDDLLLHRAADAVMDLLFENGSGNVAVLEQMQGVKIVNSVIETIPELNPSFVRINGWPTFLKGHTVEAACLHEDLKKLTETVFAHFNKTVEWLPDAPGFVVPRVVSMIVNEAYFALAEGVSTRAQIDLAMKLGTAYPYGPFEWSEKIGVQLIAALLRTLAERQPRYAPAPLLLQQAALI